MPLFRISPPIGDSSSSRCLIWAADGGRELLLFEQRIKMQCLRDTFFGEQWVRIVLLCIFVNPRQSLLMQQKVEGSKILGKKTD